jgi:hypothetical protein
MKRTCRKCRLNMDIFYFISRDRFPKITVTCFTCRYYNASRFIAREQNKKEQIWKKLRSEKIHKIHIYTIYLHQKKKCYLCERRVNIPLIYVNKYGMEFEYKYNMFLSCMYCYYLREDENVSEFINKLKEADYPFNKSIIKNKPIHIKKNQTFIQKLLGN